jgi:hypothetical protein
VIRFNHFSGILLATAILISGCAKEGCTDENAANYNITANKDDGSCVFCSGATEQFGQTESNEIIDFRFSSPFQNESVLDISLQSKLIAFPLRNCGEGGCFLSVTVTNTTDAEISNLQFFLTVYFLDFGSNSFSFGQLPVLSPGESHTIDNLFLPMSGTNCVTLSPNQFSGEIITANYN